MSDQTTNCFPKLYFFLFTQFAQFNHIAGGCSGCSSGMTEFSLNVWGEDGFWFRLGLCCRFVTLQVMGKIVASVGSRFLDCEEPPVQKELTEKKQTFTNRTRRNRSNWFEKTVPTNGNTKRHWTHLQLIAKNPFTPETPEDDKGACFIRKQSLENDRDSGDREMTRILWRSNVERSSKMKKWPVPHCPDGRRAGMKFKSLNRHTNFCVTKNSHLKKGQTRHPSKDNGEKITKELQNNKRLHQSVPCCRCVGWILEKFQEEKEKTQNIDCGWIQGKEKEKRRRNNENQLSRRQPGWNEWNDPPGHDWVGGIQSEALGGRWRDESRGSEAIRPRLSSFNFPSRMSGRLSANNTRK